MAKFWLVMASACTVERGQVSLAGVVVGVSLKRDPPDPKHCQNGP